jgi:hypothetical protein
LEKCQPSNLPVVQSARRSRLAGSALAPAVSAARIAATGNTGQPTTVQDEVPANARNQAGPNR